ncbi:unnamed protein product [Heligmosomoides polygyrus]|uniref:GCV_T domain-containing protein n=1 Tax=Heligmosomoides polygyrus TaxID=6339 RepID=A0A183GS22_HELPZ|nr:unnamed protein product [Heligmosomoides polygyrus]
MRGSPLDAFFRETKLAERIAIVLQDFELRQLEIDEVGNLEAVEEFQPKEDCAEVTTLLTSGGAVTFSGVQTVLEERLGYARTVILHKLDNLGKWDCIAIPGSLCSEVHWAGTVK